VATVTRKKGKPADTDLIL